MLREEQLEPPDDDSSCARASTAHIRRKTPDVMGGDLQVPAVVYDCVVDFLCVCVRVCVYARAAGLVVVVRVVVVIVIGKVRSDSTRGCQMIEPNTNSNTHMRTGPSQHTNKPLPSIPRARAKVTTDELLDASFDTRASLFCHWLE